MIVLDSSAWVEILSGSEIGRKILDAVKPGSVLVPAIVNFEITRWCLARNPAALPLARQALGQGFPVPITRELAERAAEIASSHKLAMADSIIYTAAVEETATLVTLDSALKGLPGVEYHTKK